MVRYALVVILSLCPALAAAQNSSDTKATADADALFEEGRLLINQACQMFEASLKLFDRLATDRLGARLNLAACREQQGRTATALAEFHKAVLQADKNGDSRGDYARKRIDALQPLLSQIEISVPLASQLPGLAVKRDGIAVPNEEFGQPLPVDPGRHTIGVSAPGYQPWSTKVDVTKPGQIVTVEIPPLPEMPEKNEPLKTEPKVAARNLQPPNPLATSPASPYTSSKLVPLAIGAGALALLATGLGFELRAESKYDEAKSEMMSQPRRTSLYNSANEMRYAAETLAVSGLAAGGAAVWLYLRDLNHQRDAAIDTSVHVVPTVTGLALLGQF